jgi:hypothetical protein
MGGNHRSELFGWCSPFFPHCQFTLNPQCHDNHTKKKENDMRQHNLNND